VELHAIKWLMPMLRLGREERRTYNHAKFSRLDKATPYLIRMTGMWPLDRVQGLALRYKVV